MVPNAPGDAWLKEIVPLSRMKTGLRRPSIIMRASTGSSMEPVNTADCGPARTLSMVAPLS